MERLLTQSVVLLSLVAFSAYLLWRVTSTLDGVHLPLALALLGIDIWFGLRHLLAVLPALLLRLGGDAASPTAIPDVDILTVVRNEAIRVVRVALKSCLEVRGRRGLAVVNVDRRPEIDELCRAIGVTVVDPDALPDLGTEPGRRAELLLLVPASSWVSADVAVMGFPGFDDGDVGAVTLANTTHGLVWLVGTRGYLPPVFGDDRLAVRLDEAGVASSPGGPVLCRKDALRSHGGVAWDAVDPVLATQARLAAAGWRTRMLHAPGSYRMAPASEALALRERARRSADWADARRHAATAPRSLSPSSRQRLWRGYVTLAAQGEKWSVLARVGAFVVPMLALATGRLPARVGPTELLIYGGSWVALGTLARRLAAGRRQAGAENVRIGFRTMGADVAALLGQRWTARHGLLQNVIMGALLAGTAFTIVTTVGGRFTGPDPFEQFVMLLALLTVPALIRDATVAYRQQRLLPRVSYESRGRGDVLELSPEGVDVDGALPLGTTQGIELSVPLAGQRIVRRVVPATVVAHRRRGGSVESHLRMYPDDDVAVELAYFCGVTAPTMRWHGFDPRVVKPLAVPRTDTLVTTRPAGARAPA